MGTLVICSSFSTHASGGIRQERSECMHMSLASKRRRMSGHVAAALPLFLLLLNGCRSASSYLAKGNSLFDRGDYAEASLNYRKALQKDPGNADSSYRLGLSELKENKPAAALQDFLLAVRLAPDHQAARKELSSLVLGSYIADPDRPKAL